MFGFNIGFDTYDITLEVYIKDDVVQRQQMNAPKEILIANYFQLINQMSNDKRPMKIKMSREEIVWDKFEQKQRTLIHEAAFSNNAMISYEESK